MGDRMTETYEPYRPESSYELDYEEEPERGGAPRILWGRVVILAIVLLLAFLLGRTTASGPDGGISQSDFDEVAAERAALEAEVADLEEQLAAAEASAAPATAAPDDSGEATDPEGEAEGGEIYIVQKNDTLQSIAAAEYGDPDLDDFLAEVNDIEDPTQLSVGQELIIPPKPEE